MSKEFKCVGPCGLVRPDTDFDHRLVYSARRDSLKMYRLPRCKYCRRQYQNSRYNPLVRQGVYDRSKG